MWQLDKDWKKTNKKPYWIRITCINAKIIPKLILDAGRTWQADIQLTLDAGRTWQAGIQLTLDAGRTWQAGI